MPIRQVQRGQSNDSCSTANPPDLSKGAASSRSAAARPHRDPPARYEQVKSDPVLYAHANRVLHLETNPGNARALVQAHGEGATRATSGSTRRRSR